MLGKAKGKYLKTDVMSGQKLLGFTRKHILIGTTDKQLASIYKILWMGMDKMFPALHFLYFFNKNIDFTYRMDFLTIDKKQVVQITIAGKYARICELLTYI